MALHHGGLRTGAPDSRGCHPRQFNFSSFSQIETQGSTMKSKRSELNLSEDYFIPLAFRMKQVNIQQISLGSSSRLLAVHAALW